MKYKYLKLLPAFLLLILLTFIGFGLIGRHESGSMPSPMLGQRLHFFDMPVVLGNHTRFTPAVWEGEVAIVNFFASWCQPCAAEHPLLMGLAQQARVPIYGVAWKDSRDNILGWLRQRGNPFMAVGLDETGKSTVAFGLMGVPETYVIDSAGVVRYVYRAPLTQEVIRRDIVPLIDQLRTGYAQ